MYHSKFIYIMLITLYLIALTGCSIPNLYDAELPDIYTEETNNLVTNRIFSPEDIDVSIKNNQIICKNNYISDEVLNYAWYVLDEKGNAIHKEDYTQSNVFTYGLSQNGLYKIIAYIRYPDSSRMSITAANFRINNNNISLEKAEIFGTRYSSDNFDISINDNLITIKNLFPENYLMYAWYIIDTKTDTVIKKESYSVENTYNYVITYPGNYKINAYIKNNDGERTFVTAVEFEYDGIEVKLYN